MQEDHKAHYIPEWAALLGYRQVDLAKATGANKSTVNKWFHERKTPSVSYQNDIVKLMGISRADLYREPNAADENLPQDKQDEVKLADAALPPLSDKFVPVMGTAAGSLLPTNGGEPQFEGFELNRETVQYVRVNAVLAAQKDIYAISIVGDSMWPMHPSGEIRFVNPHRKFAPGDTVVLQTSHWEHDPGQAYIKIFRRKSGGEYILEQFNPQATLRIPERYVTSVHRVVPYSELAGL